MGVRMARLVEPATFGLAIILSAGLFGYVFPYHRYSQPSVTTTPTPEVVTPVDKLYEGMELMKQRSYGQAEQMFAGAIADGNSVQVAYERLAECQYYQQRDKDVMKTCDEIRYLFPNSSRAYFLKGLVLKRQGLIQQADVEFSTAFSHGEKTACRQLSGVK